jgi:S-adenosylmethionine hydrolase
MVAINIHDRPSSEATGMDVFVMVVCHRQRRIIERYWKRNQYYQTDNRIKAASDDNNLLKGHVIYIDHFGNVDQH